MEKFTKLNENKKIENNKEESKELSIDNLLSLLTLEVNGSEKEVTVDYNIKTNDKFYEGIKNYINKLYYKEKLELLEKAKKQYYTNSNLDWIDDEIDIIKESLKK